MRRHMDEKNSHEHTYTHPHTRCSEIVRSEKNELQAKPLSLEPIVDIVRTGVYQCRTLYTECLFRRCRCRCCRCYCCCCSAARLSHSHHYRVAFVVDAAAAVFACNTVMVRTLPYYRPSVKRSAKMMRYQLLTTALSITHLPLFLRYFQQLFGICATPSWTSIRTRANVDRHFHRTDTFSDTKENCATHESIYVTCRNIAILRVAG